ncbi:MAG: hypothetical protein HGB04_09680 [Chlorobiaceae bacterium]|nr:hypothetical protein [Chlorobiaceae bacterium]
MRLLPEREKLKAFMKKGLPLIFAVAWTPVIWMALALLFGSVMERMFRSWQAAIGVLGVLALLLMAALVHLFRRYGLRMFEVASEK